MRTLLQQSGAFLIALACVAGFWHAAGGSYDDGAGEGGITWLVPIDYMRPAKEGLADGWLIKPLDAFRIRRAAEAVLAGGEFREGVEVSEPSEPEAADDAAAPPEAAEPTSPVA